MKTLAYAAIGAAALLGGAGAPMATAFAVMSDEASNPFAALVGKRRARAADRVTNASVERYVLASDDRAFVLEAFANEARLEFLCGPDDPRIDCIIDPQGPAAEIFKVSVTRGPRGDIIYKNAAGKEMLRIASYGGATVYWPGEGDGLAASKSFGASPPLRLIFEDFDAARRRAQSASEIVSAAVGATIIFDVGAAPAAQGANAAVLADAVVRAAKGVKDVAHDPTGARVLAQRVKRVVFQSDETVSISLADGVLTIRYVPGRDIDGRASSDAVVRFLEAAL